jgi:hypothetical protein
MTKTEKLLCGIHASIRQEFSFRAQNVILKVQLAKWNPETENELAMGLALEQYFKDSSNLDEVKETYLTVMQDRGFNREETLLDLNDKYNPYDSEAIDLFNVGIVDVAAALRPNATDAQMLKGVMSFLSVGLTLMILE